MHHHHLQFLTRGAALGPELKGTYNPALVILSLLVAAVAAFAALQIAERLATAESRRLRLAWLTAGAVAMGCGIWSMHFVGMIAFNLPVPVSYDFRITLLSLLPGILASAIALRIISRRTITFWRVNQGGLLMGVGIGAMHYTGMAAMIVDARMLYDPLMFALSILVAHVLAAASLYVNFVLAGRSALGELPRRVAGSFIMGCAVAVMHYTGMAATHYFASGAAPAPAGVTPAALVVSIALGAFLILAIAIATAVIDRRLKRAALSLQSLIESAPDAIITSDPSGRIYVVNAQAEKLFGYDRRELLGLPLERLMAGRPAGTGKAAHGRRKDGTEFPLEISLSQESTPSGVFVTSIIRDITERIRLEAQLRASETKLWDAQKMEALGRLAGGISHDFNNHLSVIVGLCDLLAQQVPAGSEAAKDVADIKDSAEKSAALTQQLLSFSRSHAAKPKVYDVNELLKREKHALSRMLGAGFRIELAPAPAELPIRIDLSEFGQIVMNLVINARDAMPEGGIIAMEAKEAGAEAVISVRDTGTGMTPDVLSKVFEPFFTTKGAGTGLGLAIVYGIVTRGGGRIDVDSEEGKGTEFRLAFPRAEGAVARLGPVEAPAPRVKGAGLILVVEDNAALRRTVSRCLTMAGYDVLQADGPGAGAAIFDSRTGGVELVVMDVNMPGTNGLLLAKRFLSVHPDTKILFISGFGGDVMSLPDWPRDANFLPKPFTSDDLVSKVKALLV